MKEIVLSLFLITNILSFSKVEIKIFEPLRFEYLSTKKLSNEKIGAYGTIEIRAEKSDIGKKIVFDFPKSGLMTNRKKWIKVEKYGMELPEKEMVISQEVEHIKFYALLDKRDIDKGEEAKIIEGEYTGYVPIVVSEYSK
ncbi:hypothetical protein H3N56_11280 [Cetobacterium sp. 2A]|uniref:hypothetical protein n=1 Tax=Cetobacterium sp. 2A TaxID=2754723 RepID=UPI00163C51A9|nr:hypothetical protein [Cetobacterium sp. 2A]MBC2857015.1 hypothetical protein [Cetobacterium sp. 2A]